MSRTPAQIRIARIINDWWIERQHAPTMAEIAQVLGVSKVTVFGHLNAMEKNGILAPRAVGKARDLRIADPSVMPGSEALLIQSLRKAIAAQQVTIRGLEGQLERLERQRATESYRIDAGATDDMPGTPLGRARRRVVAAAESSRITGQSPQ